MALITGASRGVGLELVKQLSELPQEQIGQIFAITRTHSDSLQTLIEKSPGRIMNVIIDDITKESTVRKGIVEVETALQGQGLDYLVNVAGTNQPFTPDGLQSLDSAQLLDTFTTNVVSAHVMISSTLHLLQKGKEKKIINISTSLGSIAFTRMMSFAPAHAYKISKAALNMLTAQYAMDLEKDGFTVFAISPGWLKTDLGGGDAAHLEVSTGVDAVKELILSSDTSSNGKFMNIKVPNWEGMYDGGEIPW